RSDTNRPTPQRKRKIARIVTPLTPEHDLVREDDPEFGPRAPAGAEHPLLPHARPWAAARVAQAVLGEVGFLDHARRGIALAWRPLCPHRQPLTAPAGGVMLGADRKRPGQRAGARP